MPQREKVLRWLKDVLRVGAVVALFGTTAYLLSLPQVREELLNVEHVRSRLQEFGPMAKVVFLGLGAFATGIGVPRLWISAIAGGLFGATWGSIIGQLASIIGALVTFFLARLLLRTVVNRRMPAWMRVWYHRFNEHGFFWLFYIRLFPFANATVTNVIGGVSRVPVTTFLVATFLGYLPETIIFAMFGSSAAKKDWLQFVMAAVCLIVFLVGERVWQMLRRRRGNLVTETDSTVVRSTLEG